MDPIHFDRLTRLLGTAPSRRQLAALLGVRVAAALPGVHPDEAATGKHRKHKKKCRHDTKPCGK